MDFVNDIAKKVSKVACDAGKKGGELVNKGKIRFALANLQSDLDELYEKLGRMRYDALTTGYFDDDKEIEIITKIDSVLDDMEILKAELKAGAASSSLGCPKCGKSVKKNTAFCPYCGEKL